MIKMENVYPKERKRESSPSDVISIPQIFQVTVPKCALFIYKKDVEQSFYGVILIRHTFWRQFSENEKDQCRRQNLHHLKRKKKGDGNQIMKNKHEIILAYHTVRS